MKKIIKSLIVVTVFLTSFLSFGQARATESKGFRDIVGFVDIEILYQACLTAQEKYKDNPEEIWKSECGAYIQGIFSGESMITFYTFSKMPEDTRNYYSEKYYEDICIDESRPLYEFIDNFIAWRKVNKDYNNNSISGFIESIHETPECRKKMVTLRKNGWNNGWN